MYEYLCARHVHHLSIHQALKQMGGALRVTYESWREELKHCLAHTEAVIDFGDVSMYLMYVVYGWMDGERS